MLRSDMRKARRARPSLEGLEGRRLLDGGALRQFAYRTADGARVEVEILGPGSLAGTAVRPDGALALVFSGTTSGSQIRGKVRGGKGRAPLAIVNDANAAVGDFSGNGAEPLDLVNLEKFDLISGGSINLTGGVTRLVLGSAAANSQVHVLAVAPPSTTTSTTSTAPATGIGGGVVSGGTVTTGTGSGIGTAGSTGTGTVVGGNAGAGGTSGAGGVGSIGGVGGFGGTGTTTGTGTGTGTTTTTGTTGAGTGVTTGSGGSATGGASSPSTGITGTASAFGAPGTSLSTGSGLITSPSAAGAGGGLPSLGSLQTSGSTATTTSTSTATTGPNVVIHRINGRPLAAPPLGDAQVFGYDPTANTLIRFDARTGAALQAIPLPAGGTNIAGVGLGRNNGRLVALVGSGQSILAYDAVTGAPEGSFSTTTLGTNGLNAIDGIGSTNTQTIVSDSAAGTFGLAQPIDITASLASGLAVPLGPAFAPTREFQFSGGLTGVAGSDRIYASGAAHFDTFQPDLVQPGVMVLNGTGFVPLVELGRIALPGLVSVGPSGSATPTQALGSVDGDLALVTSVSNGKNVVTFYTPSNLTADGTVSLDSPNRLAGLSESFRPGIAGSVLVNITGNLSTFASDTARGLVLNDSGFLNRLQVGSLSDSTVVARPFGHVAVGRRNNVQILSTARGPAGKRHGVTIDLLLRPVGPLTLP